MSDLKKQRKALRLSLSETSRLSGVSRYRLANSELGGSPLRPDEEERVQSALKREAARLAAISHSLGSFEGAASN